MKRFFYLDSCGNYGILEMFIKKEKGMKTRIIVTVLTAALGIFIIWLIFRPGECCAKCKCRGNTPQATTQKDAGPPAYNARSTRRDPAPPRAAPRWEPPARKAAPTPRAPLPAPAPAAAKAPPAKPSAPPAKNDCANCVGQTYEELGITDSHK